MAAPSEMTTLDITGKFVMNKSLSDSSDEILRLQGVSWFTRKIIAAATITLEVKHYKDDGSVEHIDIKQTLSGGFGGTDEERTLDWTGREKSDRIFGDVVGKSRRVKLDEIDNEYLKNGFTSDVAEHGAIEAYVESDTPKSGTSWIADQIWGFEVVDDARRYVRHVHFTGPQGEIIQARLVYDYIGTV